MPMIVHSGSVGDSYLTLNNCLGMKGGPETT